MGFVRCLCTSLGFEEEDQRVCLVSFSPHQYPGAILLLTTCLTASGSDLGHLGGRAWQLYVKLLPTLIPLHATHFGRKSLCAAHIWRVEHLKCGQSIYVNYSKFCAGKGLFNLCVCSIIYLYRLMDIYFTLRLQSSIYFVAQSVQSLGDSCIPLTHCYHCDFHFCFEHIFPFWHYKMIQVDLADFLLLW